MESAKQRLFPGKSVDNAQFMNSLLAKLDKLESQSGDAAEGQSSFYFNLDSSG